MVAAVPAVRLIEVGKTFPKRGWVLRDVAFELAAGEFVTLLGPSGSGKTALLTMLAGRASPDAGMVEIDGGSIAAVAPGNRGIGLVPQDRALFPNMSVAENVALPLLLSRTSANECRSRVAQMLGLLRLGPVLDRPLRHLTDEQRFRVSLARALVTAPKALMLDEPFASLDSDEHRAILAMLRDLHRRLRVTVLLATRDRMAALGVGDRVALLYAGRIVQIDRPGNLYDRPASALVARMTGEDNQLPGWIVATEDEIARVRLSSGHVVEAGLTEPLAPGADCVVSVRPERIAVAAVSAAEFGQDAVAAQVVETIHLGDHWRLRLSIVPEPGRPPTEVVVKRPISAPIAGFVPGREVAVGWQPSYARVFPGGG